MTTYAYKVMVNAVRELNKRERDNLKYNLDHGVYVYSGIEEWAQWFGEHKTKTGEWIPAG